MFNGRTTIRNGWRKATVRISSEAQVARSSPIVIGVSRMGAQVCDNFQARSSPRRVAKESMRRLCPCRHTPPIEVSEILQVLNC